MAGMSTLSTRALTIWEKAAPMMTATARSITLPFMMNSLKPLNMPLSVHTGFGKEEIDR